MIDKIKKIKSELRKAIKQSDLIQVEKLMKLWREAEYIKNKKKDMCKVWKKISQ